MVCRCMDMRNDIRHQRDPTHHLSPWGSRGQWWGDHRHEDWGLQLSVTWGAGLGWRKPHHIVQHSSVLDKPTPSDETPSMPPQIQPYLNTWNKTNLWQLCTMKKAIFFQFTYWNQHFWMRKILYWTIRSRFGHGTGKLQSEWNKKWPTQTIDIQLKNSWASQKKEH